MATLKRHFLRQKSLQRLSAALVILVVAIVGIYVLSGSHAATPYTSITASNGTAANGATAQTCGGSTAGNGQCVVFNGNGGGNNMIVGLDEAGYGPGAAQNVAGAVQYDRFDQSRGEPVSDFTSQGLKLDVLFVGPYNTGGVSALNATSWVNTALTWYQTNCTPVTACPMLEVLNEPGGNVNWGPQAVCQTQQTASNCADPLAYAALVKATYTAFHAAYGASAPLILAAFDGSSGWAPAGQLANEAFGTQWWSSSISPYVDGVVVHPYGGTGSMATSKLGDRQIVTNAHNYTGKPVYVTEVGWPTAVGQPSTGDSLQWPQTNTGPGTGDQCNNVYNFINWARGTGYVNAVYIFGYTDYGTNDFYGMFDSSGTAKPAFGALKAAAHNQANPCPNPLAY